MKVNAKALNGYFEFNRKYLFIPAIFINYYENSKVRIKPSNDNGLIVDYKDIVSGTSYVLIPFYVKKEDNNMTFNRIEDEAKQTALNDDILENN